MRGEAKNLTPDVKIRGEIGNPTVPPCLQEARRRPEPVQQRNTETKRQADRSQRYFSRSVEPLGVADGAQRGIMPLVSSVTGGPGPVVPGGSGVVRPLARAGPSQQTGPSLGAAEAVLLRQSQFNRANISPQRGNVKGGGLDKSGAGAETLAESTIRRYNGTLDAEASGVPSDVVHG